MTDIDANARVIFFEALERASQDELIAYLEEACGTDLELRRRVDDLLRAHQDAGNFLGGLVMTVDTGDQVSTEKPGDVVGRYRLREQIGEGGFGVVYLAEQQRPVRRRVALKLVKPGMDTQAVIARFDAERQALAMMDHPNIAKVLDGGATEQGRPYFVMELVQGVPITEYCDQCSLTTRERLELFVLVGQAVQHAHQQGVIHRDIKPTNVLVAMQDGRPTPKIIDFGVAKAINQRLTEHTLATGFAQMIGTPLYMSPEQAELSPLGVDTRSDIYSLGVLLYELLTGTTPFDKSRLKSASFDELRRIIREEEPPLPSTRISTLAADPAGTVAKRFRTDPRRLLETVRGDLDWIVMKALEKDRTRRYESAGAFIRDVGRFLSDEPIEARPQSTLYRVRKFTCRNRTLIVAATLAASAVLFGAAISTWQAIRATAAYREAARDSRQAVQAGNVARLQQQRAEKALVASRRSQAELALEKGQLLGRQGDASLALLWMARALNTAPNDAADLRQAIRFNLFAWSQEIHLLRHMLPHAGRLDTGAVQPDAILAGSRVGNEGFLAYRWNAQTGTPLQAPWRRMRGMVISLQFDEQGRNLAAGYLDGRVELLDVETGKVQELSSARQLGPVTSLVFSPQGEKLLIAACAKQVQASEVLDENSRQFQGPGLVQVVDVVSGKPLLNEPIQHDELVWTAVFSRDGNTFVTESSKWFDVQANGQARFWNLRGEQIRPPLSHPGGALVLALNLEGDQLLTGHWDSQARLWNVSQPEIVLEKSIACHGPVGTVAFHPRDPDLVLLGDYGGTLRVWRVSAGHAVGPILRHPHLIRCARFSADGRYVLCGTRAAAHVWELAPGNAETAWSQYRPAGGVLAVDHANKRVLVEDGGGLIRLRNALSGDPVGKATLSAGPVARAALDIHGRLAALIGIDGLVRMWDLNTGELLNALPFPEPAYSVAISPDGGTVAVGYHGDVTVLWNPWVAQEIATFRHQAHSGPVFSVEFSANGQRLLTGGADGLARLWDIPSGQEIKRFPPMPFVSSARFSPDDSKILVCGGGEGARVWQVDGDSPVGLPLRHEGPIIAAQFSEDGRMVLTGGTDGTARLWDLATGRQLGPALQHKGAVHSVWFWPDGRTLLTIADSVSFEPGGPRHDARYWQTPQPLPASDAQFERWVQTVTGMRLDENGDLRLLDPESWKAGSQSLGTLENSAPDTHFR